MEKLSLNEKTRFDVATSREATDLLIMVPNVRMNKMLRHANATTEYDWLQRSGIMTVTPHQIPNVRSGSRWDADYIDVGHNLRFHSQRAGMDPAVRNQAVSRFNGFLSNLVEPGYNLITQSPREFVLHAYDIDASTNEYKIRASAKVPKQTNGTGDAAASAEMNKFIAGLFGQQYDPRNGKPNLFEVRSQHSGSVRKNDTRVTVTFRAPGAPTEQVAIEGKSKGRSQSVIDLEAAGTAPAAQPLTLLVGMIAIARSDKLAALAEQGQVILPTSASA